MPISHPFGDPVELAKLALDAQLILDRPAAGPSPPTSAPRISTPKRSGSRLVASRAAALAASYTRSSDECERYGRVKAAPIGRRELDKTPTQAQLCAHPCVAAWYATQPDPVVLAPDREMYAVNDGFTAQAWHAENRLAT